MFRTEKKSNQIKKEFLQINSCGYHFGVSSAWLMV